MFLQHLCSGCHRQQPEAARVGWVMYTDVAEPRIKGNSPNCLSLKLLRSACRVADGSYAENSVFSQTVHQFRMLVTVITGKCGVEWQIPS